MFLHDGRLIISRDEQYAKALVATKLHLGKKALTSPQLQNALCPTYEQAGKLTTDKFALL